MTLMEAQKILTEQFNQLGAELGMSGKTVTVSPGWWTKLVYIMYEGHALQMEISTEYVDLHMYAVRCIDGQIPASEIYLKYPDGSWYRKCVTEIYGADSAPEYGDGGNDYSKSMSEQKWNEFLAWYSDDNVSAHMFKMFEYYRDIILRDPNVLLTFLRSIE